MRYSYDDMAKMIDHSLLHPTMTDKELEDGCKLAAKYGVASVCIKPYAVKRAAELLQGSGVLVGAVIGWSFGAALAVRHLGLALPRVSSARARVRARRGSAGRCVACLRGS